MRISDWSSDVCSSDLGEQAVALQQHADTAAHAHQPAIAARHGFLQDFDGAAAWQQFAGKRVQQGRFAGTAGPEHRSNRAFRHSEADIVEDDGTATLDANAIERTIIYYGLHVAMARVN